MKLFNEEMTKSIKKHGKWDDYSTKSMFDKIEDEFAECVNALLKNDHKSVHRLSVELLQVAVCCCKMSRQIRKRNEED